MLLTNNIPFPASATIVLLSTVTHLNTYTQSLSDNTHLFMYIHTYAYITLLTLLLGFHWFIHITLPDQLSLLLFGMSFLLPSLSSYLFFPRTLSSVVQYVMLFSFLYSFSHRSHSLEYIIWDCSNEVPFEITIIIWPTQLSRKDWG